MSDEDSAPLSPSRRTDPEEPRPAKGSQRGLDWLNFFVTDVETAFGPFVAVYLTTQGWTQSAIGTAITVSSSAALATQIPAGWLVDRVHAKRLVVAICLACIAAGALLIALFPQYVVVIAGEALHGLTGGAVSISVAAIGLGLVGHRAFHTRVGRNQRYQSLGSAATAAGMGAIGHLASPRAPFFIAAALCLPAAFALAMIRGSDIDNARARQSPSDGAAPVARWSDLMANRTLLVFAGCLFLFQFANASLLPLASERLVAGYRSQSELYTAAMVVVPQLATALIAGCVANKADVWGRKKLLVAAFAALLARTVLFAWIIGPWFLITVQLLDGLTAAVIGILTPLIVADCTKRTGLFNLALGATGMISGVGATISTTVTGIIAQAFGFTWAFITLGIVASVGVAAICRYLPETVQEARGAKQPIL